ncbi:MAG: DNA polymerase III subunit beta [Candidatus Yanofskybacteria bacterium]|nr:DNA polymerase III subunit beta [Candidatus Yanofskybacteria bacterium]
MKITVHKERFARALGFVERITSRNSSLPILNNVLLKTEHGRLKVSATNLEIGVTSVIGASVEREGQIAVPGKTIADFVRSVPGETLDINVDQHTLSASSGSYQTSILCFDPAEYPIIPKIDGGEQFVVSVETLQRLIDTVSDSIATSDSRPELSGALLRFDTGIVSMAATDIFRLAEQREDGEFSSSGAAIVPRGTIYELRRVLGGLSGDITVHLTDNQIAFVHEDCEIVSRLIDGKYPDYKKIIPERANARVLVRREEIENAVKTAALFSSSISDIKLECSGAELKITGKNSNKGEAYAGVEANLKGDPFDVSMNYHYLLDGLRAVPTEKIILEFTGKGSPFVLRPHSDDPRTVYLIMPLRSS